MDGGQAFWTIKVQFFFLTKLMTLGSIFPTLTDTVSRSIAFRTAFHSTFTTFRLFSSVLEEHLSILVLLA